MKRDELNEKSKKRIRKMDIDEVVMRVEQILSGDLYYLDQEK